MSSPIWCRKSSRARTRLHILGEGNQVRHYTYGGDLARGIRLCIEHPAAVNQDFNLSTATRTTVLGAGELVWRRIHGSGKPFRYVSDKAYEYDVQERSPVTEKAGVCLAFRQQHPGRDSR